MPCNGDCNQGRECNCQSKMKLCKDCKFFKPMDFGNGSFFNLTPPKPSECLSEFCVDLVDGSKNTVPYARREICGVDGKYWEVK